MEWINTIDDYIKLNYNKIYIESNKHGKIEVPCCNVILVKKELIIANNYNPNSVPDDKMELLKESILDNGFCFPIVTIFDNDQELFVIVDGFHRDLMGDKKWLDLDYIPVVVLNHGIQRRMTATVQFNKARGVHSVELDAEVIRKLIEQGMNEEEISIKLGIEEDTIHRYKQLTGVAEIFKNSTYSTSWDMYETESVDV